MVAMVKENGVVLESGGSGLRHRHVFELDQDAKNISADDQNPGGFEPGSATLDARAKRANGLGSAQKSMMVLTDLSSLEYEGLREPGVGDGLVGKRSLGAADPSRASLWKSGSGNSSASFRLRRATSRKVEEYHPQRWNAKGVNRMLLEDWAFITLGLSMPQLVAFVLSVYLAFILLFALAFYVQGPQHLAGYDSGSSLSDFEVAFWYSAINLVTTGFGNWMPTGRASCALATVEHFFGLLLSSLLLSVIVTKASMTRAMLIFSDVATINQCNGVVTLTCRVGNARGNFLYAPDIRMCYVRPICSAEGNFFWEEEPLATHDAVSLKPVYYITHAITRDSPLYNKTEEDLLNEKGFIAIVVSATDDQTFQTLYARTVYRATSLLWNRRLEEVLVERISAAGKAKSLTIDFNRFHDTIPMEPEYRINNTADLEPPEDPTLSAHSEEISIVEAQMTQLMQKLEELRSEMSSEPKWKHRAAATGALISKASGMLGTTTASAIPRAVSGRLPGEPGDYGLKRAPRGFARRASLTPSGPGDPVPFSQSAAEVPVPPAVPSAPQQDLHWAMGGDVGNHLHSPFEAAANNAAVPAFSAPGPRRLMRNRVSFNTRHCSPVRESTRELNSGDIDSQVSGCSERTTSGDGFTFSRNLSNQSRSESDMPISPFASLTALEPF